MMTINMLVAQAEQVAEISGGNAVIAIWFGGAIGALILVDRIFHILQSRGLLRNGSKKTNPTSEQWNQFFEQWEQVHGWLDAVHATVETAPPDAKVPGGRLVWRDPEVTELLRRHAKTTAATLTTLETIQRSLADIHESHTALEEGQAQIVALIAKHSA